MASANPGGGFLEVLEGGDRVTLAVNLAILLRGFINNLYIRRR